jgi:hypothetical protein
MPSPGILRRVGLVRTDISEEFSASIIRVTRIGALGALAITINRRKLRRNTILYYTTVFLRSVRRLLVTSNVVPSSPILVTLIIEEIHPPKRRFLQEPHGLTSQKTAFFIATVVKASNLTLNLRVASRGTATLSWLNKQKQTPWPLVRKRPIPSERPPLVDEI